MEKILFHFETSTHFKTILELPRKIYCNECIGRLGQKMSKELNLMDFFLAIFGDMMTRVSMSSRCSLELLALYPITGITL